MNVIRAIIVSMRPRQWTKNVFVLAALVFSQQLFYPAMVVRALAAFALFCAVSGAVYILNDILDRARDKLHPVKCARPIAAGLLRIPTAAIAATVAAAVAITGAFALGVPFALWVIAYLLLQIAYSVWFKHVVILDVLALAFGFVVRVVAGGAVLGVEISSWLLLCSTLLALFLALCKRRHEITSLADDAAEHRQVLAEYSPYLLDQMIVITAAATVVAYALYTMADTTLSKFGTDKLILTLPFVIYGLFRYLFLVHRRAKGGSPEHTLVSDTPLLIAILLWALSAGIIVYA